MKILEIGMTEFFKIDHWWEGLNVWKEIIDEKV